MKRIATFNFKLEPRSVAVPHTGLTAVSEVTVPGPFASFATMPENAFSGYFSQENRKFWRSQVDCLMYGRFVVESIPANMLAPINSSTDNSQRVWQVVMVDDSGATFLVAAPPLAWDGKPVAGAEPLDKFDSEAIAHRFVRRLVGDYTPWTQEAIDVDRPPIPETWHATLKSGRGDENSPNECGKTREEARNNLIAALWELDEQELYEEGRIADPAADPMGQMMGSNT